MSQRDETERVRFQARLLEAAGQAIIATDLSGNIVYWNRAAERMYGWSTEEVAGRAADEVLISDELRERGVEIMAGLGRGDSWSGEFTVTHKDGEPLQILVSDTPVYDGEGEIVGIVGVSTDITERKRMEKALRESEERFHSLVRNAFEIVGVTDADGTVRYVSPAIEKVLGWKPEACAGMNILAFSDPLQREETRERIANLGERPGEIIHYEVRAPHMDGSHREMVVSAVNLLDDPAVRGLVFNCRDITDRKQMEEALHESWEFLSSILENAPTPIYIVSAEDRMRLVNKAYENLFGIRREEIVGSLIEKVFSPDMARRFGEINHRVLETESPEIMEIPVGAPDGHHDLQVVKFPLRDPDGRVEAVGGIAVDVTERHRAEKELRESEEQLRQLYDGSFEGIFIHDGERILEANEALIVISGYEKRELIGSPSLDFVTPESREPVRLHVQAGSGEPYEVVGVRKDGEHRALEIRGRKFQYRGREARLVSVRDITERKRAEDALRESEERFRTLTDAALEALAISERDDSGSGEIHAVNRAFTEIFGYEPEEVIGKGAEVVIAPESRELVEENIASGYTGIYEAVGMKKDGTRFDLEIRGKTAIYRDRRVRISALRDVTERKRAEEQLAHRAFHDPLTGLANRALFVDRLDHALTRVGRRDTIVAVLFADLDGFKTINDSFGHETGDRLLVLIAERLESCLRPEDTLARFGGDEFIILLEDMESPADAARVADRIAEELHKPFSLEEREVFASVSIGICLSGFGDASPEEMIRKADTAMYQAKRRGLGGYAVFEPEMYDRVLKRLELENDLRRAIEQEQFRLHYQPQIDLRSGRIGGVEALVRWEHPERGLLAPCEFIPTAEETSLIVPLGRWVFEEACRQARVWQSEFSGVVPLKMSVNFSLKQFQYSGLVEEVAETMRRVDLESARLSLEITESVAMREPEQTVSMLRRLKELGLRLAIDDFGTGYSSLSYLIKQFRMDLLKIDRTFIGELTEDPEYEAIISAIIGLARSLKLEVVAEGVETARQYELLLSMGCDMGQGYFFSKPLPAEEMSEILSENPRW